MAESLVVEMFQKLDVNNDGKLMRAEVTNGSAALGMTAAEAGRLFDQLYKEDKDYRENTVLVFDGAKYHHSKETRAFLEHA